MFGVPLLAVSGADSAPTLQQGQTPLALPKSELFSRVEHPSIASPQAVWEKACFIVTNSESWLCATPLHQVMSKHYEHSHFKLGPSLALGSKEGLC